MKRVLITGAAGRIGRLLRERLAGQYDFSGISLEPAEFPTHVADISDLEAILPAFNGIDAVVHLAANTDAGGEFMDMVQHNIIGTRNVYEAAHHAGVGQVIFASSNHAVSGWEIECGPNLYDLADPRTLDEHAEIRPDGFYGFSKAAGEALGRQYADLHGLRVLCLRIGWVLDPGPDADPFSQDFADETVPPLSMNDIQRRLRAIWLSQRDCAHLIDCCLRAEHIQFGIYYGVSSNPRLFHDLTNARCDLGYAPQDSSPRELGRGRSIPPEAKGNPR